MKHLYNLLIKLGYSGVLALIMFSSTYAQTTNPDIPVIPPSPTAYGIGKYGLVKTGLHTGTASVEVPIWEYKTPNLSVPISLNYSSNGIKVEELSSKTGIGWNLNAGGVVIRMIKDEPDNYYRSGPEAIMPEEVFKEVSVDKFNALLRTYLLRSARSRFDAEYDIFAFNFLQFKGKFIITEKGEILQETQSSLRIETIGGMIENGFIITDDSGIKYVFTAIEKTQVSNGQDNRSPACETAWYLSEIDHPKGDKIYFTYYSFQTSFLYRGGEDYVRLTSGQADPALTSYMSANSGYHEYTPAINTLEGKRLSGISSNYNQRVNFYAENDNPAQAGDSLLTRVVVTGDDDRILEDAKMTYKVTTNKRVFLDTVAFLMPGRKYTLNYYSPELVPERNSRRQDHWGFYNGKNNTTLLPSDTNFPGAYSYANRSPDSVYGIMGLLKEVIYPTGGRTEIIYEANQYPASKMQETSSQVTVTSQTGMIDTGQETESVVITPAINKTVTILATLSNATLSECPDTQDPDVIRRKGGTLRVYDLTTGQNTPTLEYPNDQYVTITNGLGSRTYSVRLAAGHQYKLILKTFSCSRLVTSTTYTSRVETVYYNEITGGMRVKEIREHSLYNLINTTTYQYVDTISSTKSSGIVPYISIDYFSHRVKYFFAKESSTIYKLLPYDENKVSSNSAYLLYDISGNNVVYSTVIERKTGAASNNGLILHHFRYRLNSNGNLIYGSYPKQSNTYSNMSWENGLEDHTVYYKNSNAPVMVREIFNTYAVDKDSLLQIMPMVRVQNSFSTPCDDEVIIDPAITPTNICGMAVYYDPYPCASSEVNKRYRYSVCSANHRHIWKAGTNNIKRCIATGSMNTDAYILHPCYGLQAGTSLLIKKTSALEAIIYNFYSHRYTLSSKKVIDYDDNGNIIVNVTQYKYDDDHHIKSIEMEQSNGEMIKTSNSFPTDLRGSAVYDSMIARNMTGYIVEQTQSNVNKNREIARTVTPYQFWNGTSLIVPKEIQKSFASEPLFKEVIYKQYNNNGHLVEIENKSGITEAYIWGYNNRYPVARIVGGNYNTAVSLINQSTISNPLNDQQLRDELKKIRTGLPGTQVFSYTYLPFIGMTSETDPSGRTAFYEYDAFGRLKLIKDQHGKILKQYDYQYQKPITQ